jgi:hypothetical protein
VHPQLQLEWQGWQWLILGDKLISTSNSFAPQSHSKRDSDPWEQSQLFKQEKTMEG